MFRTAALLAAAGVAAPLGVAGESLRGTASLKEAKALLQTAAKAGAAAPAIGESTGGGNNAKYTMIRNYLETYATNAKKQMEQIQQTIKEKTCECTDSVKTMKKQIKGAKAEIKKQASIRESAIVKEAQAKADVQEYSKPVADVDDISKDQEALSKNLAKARTNYANLMKADGALEAAGKMTGAILDGAVESTKTQIAAYETQFNANKNAFNANFASSEKMKEQQRSLLAKAKKQLAEAIQSKKDAEHAKANAEKRLNTTTSALELKEKSCKTEKDELKQELDTVSQEYDAVLKAKNIINQKMTQSSS